MSWDFKVGDKVVCVNIDHSQSYQSLCLFLTVGNIYTIRWIGEFKFRLALMKNMETAIAVRLNEVDGVDRDCQINGPDVPFFAYRFKPLIKKQTSIEVFTKLLLPVKELV